MPAISLKIVVVISLFFSGVAFAQDFQQTIRGEVQDAGDKSKLPGAKIVVTNTQTDSLLGTAITNNNGVFVIEDMPVGRHRISVSSLNYEPIVLEDVMLTSAKELVLDIELIPGTKSLEAVEVLGVGMRGEPMNRMAITSAITITQEQTSTFAGSWDDPLRVAAAYPGVVQQSAGFNEISVRGQSPVGMLYRLEGIPIHNPNHFAAIGSSGGFVTQFSSAVLGNSDFYSGVFPAELGNATTAAFDFRFRNGNNQEYEHALKASVFGLDIATEGPFSKNSEASYLINYRYSTLGILANLINIGGVEPVYQDLSFNVNIPTKKAGTFKIFGIGGLSNFILGATRDTAEWTPETNRSDQNFGSNSSTIGLSHIYKTTNGYWHTGFAGSVAEYFSKSNYLLEDLSESLREQSNYIDNRITGTVDYNHKFNDRYSTKAGFIFTHIHHDYLGLRYTVFEETLDTIGNTVGNGQYFQAFAQGKASLGEAFTLTGGAHFLYFLLNDKVGVDPRVGLTYQPNLKSKFTLAYGHHSRVEDLTFYYIQQKNEEGQNVFVNRDVELLKSHQWAFNYSQMLTRSLRLTTEVYYQYLYDVPAEVNGSYSVLNVYNGLPVGELANVGEGQNYGLEIMLQQFTHKGFYYMASLAFFDATYRAGDGVWRNMEFNHQFSYNILAGKEFVLKEKENKKRLMALNLNFRHSGGAWRTPIDLEASQQYGWTRLDNSNPYSLRQPNPMGLDFTLNFQVIRKKVTSKLSVSIKNIFTNRAVLSEYYDIESNSIKQTEDYGTIPIIGYTLYF